MILLLLLNVKQNLKEINLASPYPLTAKIGLMFET